MDTGIHTFEFPDDEVGYKAHNGGFVVWNGRWSCFCEVEDLEECIEYGKKVGNL